MSRPGMSRRLGGAGRRDDFSNTTSGPVPPTYLVPNGDISTLPADITPVPPTILNGHWSMTVTPAQPSATLPNDFGMVGLMGLDGNHRIALQQSGASYRIDLYDDIVGTQQVGIMTWLATPSILIDVDVVSGVLTATSAGVTFTGAWDSVAGNTATKALSIWTWTGTTLNIGGVVGLFEFDGTIQDIIEV